MVAFSPPKPLVSDLCVLGSLVPPIPSLITMLHVCSVLYRYMYVYTLSYMYVYTLSGMTVASCINLK